MLAKPKAVPAWVIRWHGAFGVTYIGRDPEITTPSRYQGWVVHNIELAKKYPTQEGAESAALVMAAKFPEFIGKLEVREWDGRRKRP